MAKAKAATATNIPFAHWIFAVSAAVACAVYSISLNAPFVFDDLTLPMLQSGGAGWNSWRHWIGGVRPVLGATYWWNMALGGTDPFGYRLVNLAFHLAAAWLVYAILERTLAYAHPTLAARARLAAAAGATAFLLHPLQTEAVAYVAGRADVLSAFFALAAALVYLRGFRRGLNLLEAAAVLVLFAASVGAKEQTVALPAILTLIGGFRNWSGLFEDVRRNLKLFVPIAVGAVAGGAVILKRVLDSPSAGAAAGATPFEYFATSWRAIARYLGLSVFPVGQTADAHFPWSSTVLDHGAIFALAALLGGGWFLWRKRRSHPLALSGYLIALLALLPVNSIVPLQDVFFERRFYFGLFGVCLAVSEWAFLTFDGGKLWAATAIVGAILAVLSYGRVELWNDPFALWTDVIAKAPEKARGYFWRGQIWLNAGRCPEAVTDLTRYSELNSKKEAAGFVYLALAHTCAGDGTGAVRAADAGLTVEPGNGNLRWSRSRGLIQLKRYGEALEEIDRAIGRDANVPGYWTTRAIALSSMNRRPEAIAAVERALQLSPSDSDALRVMAELRGRP